LPPSKPNDDEMSDYHTTSSKDPALQSKLRHYIVAFLNRELPSSPSTRSRLGKVVWNLPKKEQHSTWVLTEDWSVAPSRQELAEQTGFQIQEVKDTTSRHRCRIGESSVLVRGRGALER
jgi:hypothetical protein